MVPREKSERKIIPLGHISGVHGVSGWVRIHSQTEPREAIFEYQPWLLGDELQPVKIKQGKKHGKYLLALIEGVDDRDRAEGLVSREIAVYRDQLPELPDSEYYWTDLMGAAVQLADGTELGRVRHLLATGANDVMVVRGERERLIPFVQGQYVISVDLREKVIVVDWDPEF